MASYSTPDNAPPKRLRMHDIKPLCTGILSTIQSGPNLEIRCSGIKGAGSGLFVAPGQDDIASGQEIFRSMPLISCRDPQNPHICDWCFSSSKSGLHPDGRFITKKDILPTISACGGCKIARYCSKACQKMAWSGYHKYECSIIGKIPNLSAVVLAFYRVLLLEKVGMVDSGHWVALQHMESSFLKFDDSKAEDDVLMTAIQAGNIIGGLKHDLNIVWSLYCKLLTNCMNMRPAESEVSLGCSLDLATAMMNHDCHPNVFVFFEGGQLRARSLRKIRAGDELLVSYVDTRMSQGRRRAALKANSFIDCTCEICELWKKAGDQPNPDTLLHAQQYLAERLDIASTGFYGPFKENTDEVLQPFLKEVQHYKKTVYGSECPDDVDPMPVVRLALADMYATRDDYGTALRYALKGFPFMGIRKGPAWVADMHLVCRVLEKVCFYPKDSDTFATSGFISREQARLLLSGYLRELKLQCAKVFGEDTRLAVATAKWAEAYERAGRNQPPMDNPEFAKRFRDAQVKLLEWATVQKISLVQLS